MQVQERTRPESDRYTPADIKALLAKVDSIKDVLAADADEAERISKLPLTSVAAMQEAGLYGLKAPREIGGHEADLATQLAVYEEVTYYNPSAGWNLFVSTSAWGIAAAFLPEETLAIITSKTAHPTFTGGGGHIPGRLTPVEGGYLLSGDWKYGSGIDVAEWSSVPAQIVTRDGSPGKPVSCVVPTEKLVVHDTWHVFGMAGSGSHDYSARDIFVPEGFLYDRTVMPRRGGALYRIGLIGFVTVEIVGVMLGLARRSLDEIIGISRTKARGYAAKTSMKTRPVLQRSLAEMDMELKAARALNLDVCNRAMAAVKSGQMTPSLELELRAAAVLAAEKTLHVGSTSFRHGAGTAMRLDNLLQRNLRDLYAADTHFVVSDTAYEAYGQHLLGGADISTMA